MNDPSDLESSDGQAHLSATVGDGATQDRQDKTSSAIGDARGIDTAAELERIAEEERAAKEAEAINDEVLEPSMLTKYFDRLHPLGWVAVGFGIVGIIATAIGTDMLIGRMSPILWLLILFVIVGAAIPKFFHAIRLGIETISDLAGGLAKMLVWVIFVLQFVNVVTRYTNDWFERDILFAQVESAARVGFALLFLLGAAYGVKAQVNPRIDFWWADFSKRKKAWLDFTLHTFFFLPFLVLGVRILIPFAARSLGQNPVSGAWPNGAEVWRSWNGPESAGGLPLGPIKAFLLVGFVLWAAQIVAEIIKSGYVLAGRDDFGDVKVTDVPMRVE